MGSLIDELEKKIKDKKTKIGIIGMGYVGIPLGLKFAGTGFSVTGFDKDSARVKEINSGKQVIKHIPANGRAWIHDDTKYHTVTNGGETPRVSLVTTLLT